MKLRTQFEWWFPGGFRMVYQGNPMTRITWIKLTWRGYLAMWHLAFLIPWVLLKAKLKGEL